MPAMIRFEVFGEVQLERTLERFTGNIGDASPAWEAIADDFLDVEAGQFRSEGGRGSGGWSPLTPRYGAWKATHFPGRPILVREGDLEHSLTHGPEIRIISARRMELGSAVPYGRYHQSGTPRMPRRRPIDLTEADRRRWVRILQRWIVEGRAEA
jgi:phage gpG-like protein